jgi:hypothetical protein
MIVITTFAVTVAVPTGGSGPESKPMGQIAHVSVGATTVSSKSQSLITVVVQPATR